MATNGIITVIEFDYDTVTYFFNDDEMKNEFKATCFFNNEKGYYFDDAEGTEASFDRMVKA